jgi:hypothetical protein
MFDRRNGNPTFRVPENSGSDSGNPELPEQSALFKNSHEISKVIHPLTESTQHKLTTQYNFTSIEERRGQKGMKIGEEKQIIQVFTDLAC